MNKKIQKAKSFFRNSLNHLRKAIIKDGLKQKRISVVLNNIQVIKCKKESVTSIFDYKRIIEGPSFFKCNEYYRGNNHYGIAKVLRDYSGYQKPINACIEHGVYFGNYVCKDEAINSGLNGVITFSNQRLKHINEVADVPVVPIGPYIIYANSLLDSSTIKALKEENGKTLLIFPSHSIDRIDTVFDIDAFIRKIKLFSSKHGFETVYICLFYKDILLGRDIPYLENGFKVVTGGYRDDPLFLRRLRTFIELCDYSGSNDIGTHIGYCISLNKPHIVFQQKIDNIPYSKADLENDTSSFNPTVKIEMNDVAQYFFEFEESISNQQLQIVDKYWGLNCVRPKDELFNILSSFEK